MRIFVAGATGVIGRRLVPMLVANGHRVTAMTRSADKAPAIEALGAEAAVTDVFDAERLTEAVGAARPEAVIDQLTDLPAAMNPRKAETELAGNDRIRTEGTANLVAAARGAGASAFVAQSIAFAYAYDGDGLKTEDDPLALDAAWPWRRSVEAVRELETATTGTDGLRGVALRYGFVYGPGTSFDPAGGPTAEMVRKRRYPVVGRGGGVFSFVHIDDAARAAVHAVEGDASGVFNVADDEPAPLRDWLPVYAEAIGASPPAECPPSSRASRRASRWPSSPRTCAVSATPRRSASWAGSRSTRPGEPALRRPEATKRQRS